MMVEETLVVLFAFLVYGGEAPDLLSFGDEVPDCAVENGIEMQRVHMYCADFSRGIFFTAAV